MRRAIGWIFGAVVAAGAVLAWTLQENTWEETAAEVFSGTAGCPIVVPRDAIEAEHRAASLLRTTLAKASGLEEGEFPVVIEGGRHPRRGIFIGATNRSTARPHRQPPAPFDTAVACTVINGDVLLRSERREACETAASWFLERFLGAHWFMPGPLGEVVPARRELIVPSGTTTLRPGFISRDLSAGEGEDVAAWYRRNRLEARFHHGHNLDQIFRPEDLRREPEMAPIRYGRRYFPPAGDFNWQPDLAAPAAIAHAAAAANRAFAADSRRISFSLSENDSARFDASARTLEIVSPPRFFRTRPDYSDALFGFTNAVAERVARVHPNRWLPAYAYYWAENTPRFPVAKNIVPYLTADRAQWFDPAFAAEDKQLIARWCRSGAEIVAVYDYFYGAPFLVPRPILYAVKESIPYEYQAGVRAFYAESSPNWAIDGPKAWLTAQLLWDPTRNPEALLEVYYREFWAEAAGPMREFDALCERAWLEQPRPGYWIKYYQDEHQALLYPAKVRADLRQKLAEARQLAQTAAVRARIGFVAAGWSVAEAFIEFAEARDRLARAALQKGNPAELAADWLKYVDARERFHRLNTTVREQFPLALASQKTDIYLRNDPGARATRTLVDSELGRQFLQARPVLRPAEATAHELTRLFAETRNALADPAWRNVRAKAVATSADFEFIELAGAWQGSGEPSEYRSISWRETPSAVPTSNAIESPIAGRTLRFAGCRQEFLAQWLPTKPGVLYAAEIDVRAKVSPGNQTFLIVNFLDEKQQRLGGGVIDRLPADASLQDARLCVIARAPANARYVGLGVRVIHQVNDDFAEFSRPSLRQLAE